MACNESSLPDRELLYPAHGKASAVWIVPSRALREMPPTVDADTLFHEGATRLVVGVGPEHRRLTVSPSVTEFETEWALDCPGQPWHRCVPVNVCVL